MCARSLVRILSSLAVTCSPTPSLADSPACPTIRATDGEKAKVSGCLKDADLARNSGQFGQALAAYREVLAVALQAYERDSVGSESKWFLTQGDDLVHYGTKGCINVRDFASAADPSSVRKMLVDCVAFLDLHDSNLKRVESMDVSRLLTGVQDRRKVIVETLSALPELAQQDSSQNEGTTIVQPEPPPPRAPHVIERPWKGFVVSGAVLTGLGTATMAVSGVMVWHARALEQKVENDCMSGTPDSSCSELYFQGISSSRAAVASLIVGPILLGAGVALIAVGLHRKRSRRSATRVRIGELTGFEFRF